MDYQNKDAFLTWVQTLTDTPFNLHAQDIIYWKNALPQLPELIVHTFDENDRYVQAEGLLHGLPFVYFQKDRKASLTVGEADGYPVGDGILYYSHTLADFDFTFQAAMLTLVPGLQPYPWCYHFNALELWWHEDGSYSVTDSPTTVSGWGLTPEAAYRDLQMNPMLEAAGWSPPRQYQLFLDQEVDRRPVNEDTRVWPSPQPRFTVMVDEDF